MCVLQMQAEGLTEEEACDRIYMIDIDGLITKNRSPHLSDRHKKFAKVRLNTVPIYLLINIVVGPPRHEESSGGSEDCPAWSTHWSVTVTLHL